MCNLLHMTANTRLAEGKTLQNARSLISVQTLYAEKKTKYMGVGK